MLTFVSFAAIFCNCQALSQQWTWYLAMGKSWHYHLRIIYSGSVSTKTILRHLNLGLVNADWLFDFLLIKHSKVRGAYCLGFFQNGKDSTTLLGGLLPWWNSWIPYLLEKIPCAAWFFIFIETKLSEYILEVAWEIIVNWFLFTFPIWNRDHCPQYACNVW